MLTLLGIDELQTLCIAQGHAEVRQKRLVDVGVALIVEPVPEVPVSGWETIGEEGE